MPAYIVKQPSGLFARFSTVVDDFTHGRLTEAEARKLFPVTLYEGQSYDPVQLAIADEPIYPLGFEERQEPQDGLRRWRYCCETVRAIHGDAGLRVSLAELEPDHVVP